MLFSSFRFVLDQFRQHIIRFLLTVSGVAVGVGSLVFLASFITVGLDVLVQTSTHAIGDDIMTIRESWHLRREYPNEKRLSEEDRQNLVASRMLRKVSFAPQYGPDRRDFTFEDEDGEVYTMGLTPPGFVVNRLELTEGRLFFSDEYERFSKVAIVGADLLKDHVRPWVGKQIRVGGNSLLIVGVLRRKPVMGPDSTWNWNHRLILPASTYNLLFNIDKAPNAIVGRVARFAPRFTIAQSLDAARRLAGHILMMVRQHKNFRISGAEEGDGNEKTTLIVIKVLMYMTTIFSLLVGGINIMNIMLVTVTERTREIGLRRAMGATRRDIVSQFLIESVLVTLTGALFGLAGGFGLIGALSAVLTKVFYPWPYHVEWWSVFLGIGLSILVGAVFGIGPALEAARLDPVEALRYE